MVPYERAVAVILEQVRRLPPERVGLEAAAGRASADAVRADRALPPRDNAQMDGYAVRAADLAAASEAAPVALRVAQRIFAGGDALAEVRPGEAARIMTGAPMPPGADSVVMQEDVRADGDRAWFAEPVEAGEHVRRAGEDVRPGDPVVAAGARLTASELALLAALGRTHLRVYRRPRVAILSTGDELADLGEAAPGKLVDSNSLALAVRVRALGGEPVLLGAAKDDKPAILEHFRSAAGCDVVISSAGVSVGEKDYVKEVLRELGATLHLEKVAIRPGKPLAFATAPGQLYFGLPGNPVSSRVTFELFVAPALRAMQALPGPRTLPARLARAFPKPEALTFFARVRLERRGAELWAVPQAKQSSGNLTSLVGADGLAVLPAGLAEVAEGAPVEVLPLD